MKTPVWQKLIWAVMFLVVCEGAIRKWVLPGYQAQIYLVKDGLLVLAYLGFLSSRPPPGAHLKAMAGVKILLIMSLVYFGLQLLNPNSPSPLVSLVGFKNYLLYVPLIFVVPYMFSSSKDVEQKLRKYAILMIPFAGLGLVQFGFGPDHWINGYVSYDSDALGAAVIFGDVPKARTSGTFSYIGGYSTFLTVMVSLAAGLATSERWRISGNVWVLSLLAISTAALFTTGSRAPIYSLILTFPLMLLVWRAQRLISMRDLVRILVVGAIMWVAVSFIAPDAIEAYSYRAQHSDDPVMRIFSPVMELYYLLGATPVIGTGIGSTHGSAATIMGTNSYWWLQGVIVESETARIYQETGIIGFILIYTTRFWLLIKAMRLGVRFRTPLYGAMSGVIAAFFAQSIDLTVINNPTEGIYYWFAAGLLFCMHRLELQESATAVANVRGRKVPRAHSLPELATN
jgi:hypothetical protein